MTFISHPDFLSQERIVILNADNDLVFNLKKVDLERATVKFLLKVTNPRYQTQNLKFPLGVKNSYQNMMNNGALHLEKEPIKYVLTGKVLDNLNSAGVDSANVTVDFYS